MTRHVLIRLAIAVLIAPWFAMLAASPAQASAESVTMSGYAFQPAQITIHVGDSVTWTNRDQAPHDASATSGPVMFHSPTLSTGQSWTYTFSQPGTYSYYCSIHPSMRAKIVVQPAQQQSAAAPTTGKSEGSSTHTAQPSSQDSQDPSTSPAPAAAPPNDNSEPPAAAPQTTQAVAPAAQPTLNPMLLVAGLVAAVSVLCLLLIGSRPHIDPPTSDDRDS